MVCAWRAESQTAQIYFPAIPQNFLVLHPSTAWKFLSRANHHIRRARHFTQGSLWRSRRRGNLQEDRVQLSFRLLECRRAEKPRYWHACISSFKGVQLASMIL